MTRDRYEQPENAQNGYGDEDSANDAVMKHRPRSRKARREKTPVGGSGVSLRADYVAFDHRPRIKGIGRWGPLLFASAPK